MQEPWPESKFLKHLSNKTGLEVDQVQYIRELLFSRNMTLAQIKQYCTEKLSQKFANHDRKKKYEKLGKEYSSDSFRKQPKEHFIKILAFLNTVDDKTLTALLINPKHNEEVSDKIKTILRAALEISDITTEHKIKIFSRQILDIWKADKKKL